MAVRAVAVVLVVCGLVLELVRRAVAGRARRPALGPESFPDEPLLRLGDVREHGAQQDLAVLLTHVALARNQLGRAQAHRLRDTLATLPSDPGEALRNLRDLVTDLHETALADRGLVAAVESTVVALPIPVDFTCGPGVREGRLAPSVESAAFFTVCEALASTLERGGAERARVAMAFDGGRLRIDITDDGTGFDAGDAIGSSGLTGVGDRIAAVGGTLEVRSARGAGTTLTALVPGRPLTPASAELRGRSAGHT